MKREEIDKEVEEEFQKYLEKNKKNVKEKPQVDWYKFLAIFIMAIGILSTVYFLVSIILSK